MTIIDHAVIYDYAKEQLETSDKSEKVIAALAEDIFNLYFKERFNTQTITLQGHLRGVVDNRKMGDFQNQRIWNDLKRRYIRVIEGYLLEPLAKGKHTKEAIVPFFQKGEQNPHWMEDFHCVDCGCNVRVKKKGDVYTNDLKEDEEEYWVYVPAAQSACQFPEGVGHYSNIINVPSGKLVFSNYLLSLFDRTLAIVSDEYISKASGYNNSINSDYGVKLNTEFWNLKKLIYIQVGNTSPTLYQHKETHDITCKISKAPTDTVKRGKVTTDVWAVFGMDYNQFIKLCKENGKDIENLDEIEEKFKPVYIDVPAGRYEVTSYNAAKYDDQDTFFTIKAVKA